MGREKFLILLLFLDIILIVKCGYPPIGDEVQAGSVLLPASRRGRYLANIVRRQAVDGTGIKFNKDADRMNADAKKKVDVLSEELLPYIIAEQERRITLYKRIMAAIQNGEKGITVAEIRNKPPLIIRKGLMYRCPSNRAPKEPDGSGNMMCEGDIEPTAIKFDSCLSAEDKDLYVAENKYFFCNRHKVEGPDLPRNGTAVIGCAPIERTSLNYTTTRCALEDTDDVVVHFRYYPDRSYKFVTELDPDHEVCDHWNPCQIGYIFSLPSPDQATPANELWHDYIEKPEDYERDEIVPEDSYDESFNIRDSEYETSPRRVKIPVGYKYNNVTAGKQSARRNSQLIEIEKIDAQPIEDEFVVIKLLLKKANYVGSGVAATFYVSFTKLDASDNDKGREIFVKLVRITVGTARIGFNSVIQIPSERTQSITVPFDYKKCKLIQIVVRSIDSGIYNLDMAKYKLEESLDSRSRVIRIELDEIKPKNFGSYFAVTENELGHEERYKILSVIPPLPGYEVLKSTQLNISASVGDNVENTLTYDCENCTMLSVVCNGENVDTSRISIIPGVKMVSFNFPSFEDSNSCVYIGVFNDSRGTVYQKVLAAIDNNSPAVTVEPKTVETPKLYKPFEHEVSFSCDDCIVEKVSVNGIPLEMSSTRRLASSSMAFYIATQSEITIRITEFTKMYEGVYQAVFSVKREIITKTILEIRDPKDKSEDSTPNDKGENKGDDKGEEKPTEKPEVKTEEKSDDKTKEKPHDKHEEKTEGKTEEKPTEKPTQNAEEKPVKNPEEKPGDKPAEYTPEKPAENTEKKPAENTEEKPAETRKMQNQKGTITNDIATTTVDTESTTNSATITR